MNTNIIHLFNHIKLNFPALTQGEFVAISEKFEVIDLPAKELLVRQTNPCEEIFFVLNGCVRFYRTRMDDVEVNSHFAFEDYWIGDMNSMLNNELPKFSAETLEPSRLLRLKAPDFKILLDSSRPWNEFVKLKKQRSHEAALKRSTELMESPSFGLQQLITKHPNIIHRVGHGHIANYLRISLKELNELLKGKS